MNFKQLDHEHVAQAWERMKLMIRNCPTHGLNLWIIIPKFYAGLNFASRNLLDSAAGGTFMEITLGEATKLLGNIMVNYSQWHTERSTLCRMPAFRQSKPYAAYRPTNNTHYLAFRGVGARYGRTP